MKNPEDKIKSLESIINSLTRRLSLLEKENVRRKRDVEELKRNVRK
jgi:hypothetical protein